MGSDAAERQRTRAKHRILASLGEGGMANVYLSVAHGPAGFNKLLVVKAMKEDLARDPEVVAMFLEEARLAARLSHPNVVQTLEIDALGGRPVIVMEYLQGQPLSKMLFDPECRAFTLPMKLRVLAAALEGLHYIHEASDFDGAPLGLVHRDVSPQNIVVTYDGQVKVLDFGIAKGLVSNASTRTDAIKGKIRYMAPEQMSGEAIDRRADVFSAGVILWEIVTGQRIWQGRSQVNVMNLVLNEGVPAPRSVKADVPEALNAICVKALARDPAARYASAAELLAALDAAIAEMGAPVLLKDVGKALGEVFAESRAEMQALVTRGLKKVAVDGDEGTLEPVAFPAGFGAHLTLEAADAEATRTLAPTAPRDAAPTRRRAWIAFAAVGVLGVAFGAARLRASSTPAAFPESPRAAVPALAPSGEVALAAPSDPSASPALPPASSSLSSSSLSSLPARAPDAPSPRDSGVHATAPKRAVPARGPSITPAPSASASSNPSCSPPFYFDEKRIKRLKPECF